jgi:hypothetical protein
VKTLSRKLGGEKLTYVISVTGLVEHALRTIKPYLEKYCVGNSFKPPEISSQLAFAHAELYQDVSTSFPFRYLLTGKEGGEDAVSSSGLAPQQGTDGDFGKTPFALNTSI